MVRHISDPKWKSGPPEPKHSHSDHAIHPEDYVYDFDGPGRDEDDEVDGTIHNVFIEATECSREGCEASISKRHCYTVESLSDRTQQALLYAVRQKWDDNSITLTDDVVIEYIARNAVIGDHDGEHPIIGIQFDNDQSYSTHGNCNSDDTLGYVYPTETFTADTATGTCHGRPEPPSHEPYGL